ncbi:DEAD/DEAH box helicase [Treponema brennaborense]|uniref:DEAD/DEAH box helicase domain protein n=1 Tax=Treponema brennaborense (strain DSM 12168 / CIP 105900 / DD5/3) TaxID=906968 RepID=F4LPE1_TREBD|nr:DEAD/DEAH box helicase [Treponema brennaborense]AEE17003.1 DEAD/DEAH box helicase domain protein [Treponema brennaborense DSM 12168]
MDTISFETLGVSPDLCRKLTALGITEPTAVQQQVVPLLKERAHVLFQSETGTGKTFAYLLPLVQQIDMENPQVQLLIIAPTHELASQIKSQVKLLTDIKTALCIGGAPIKRQTEMLKEKPLIVIGGPARLLELIYLKKLKTAAVKAIVLDEADRLLVPELRDETCALIKSLPATVQLAACSATISQKTERLIREALPVSDNGEQPLKTVLLPPEDVLRKRITHIALYSEQRDKPDTLRKLIAAVDPEKMMVFTARPDQVDQIVSRLSYKKIDCCGLHARSDKIQRKQALDKFRAGKCRILITSDLAARGLDITGITHIVQMDLPTDDDFFIHRAGRTGRAGAAGYDIVIGDERELRHLAAVEKKLALTVYPRILYGGQLVAPADLPEA